MLDSSEKLKLQALLDVSDIDVLFYRHISSWLKVVPFPETLKYDSKILVLNAYWQQTKGTAKPAHSMGHHRPGGPMVTRF